MDFFIKSQDSHTINPLIFITLLQQSFRHVANHSFPPHSTHTHTHTRFIFTLNLDYFEGNPRHQSILSPKHFNMTSNIKTLKKKPLKTIDIPNNVIP